MCFVLIVIKKKIFQVEFVCLPLYIIVSGRELHQVMIHHAQIRVSGVQGIIIVFRLVDNVLHYTYQQIPSRVATTTNIKHNT